VAACPPILFWVLDGFAITPRSDDGAAIGISTMTPMSFPIYSLSLLGRCFFNAQSTASRSIGSRVHSPLLCYASLPIVGCSRHATGMARFDNHDNPLLPREAVIRYPSRRLVTGPHRHARADPPSIHRHNDRRCHPLVSPRPAVARRPFRWVQGGPQPQIKQARRVGGQQVSPCGQKRGFVGAGSET
jgi:hypothetical protein